jgi:hypothetical protein
VPTSDQISEAQSAAWIAAGVFYAAANAVGWFAARLAQLSAGLGEMASMFWGLATLAWAGGPWSWPLAIAWGIAAAVVGGLAVMAGAIAASTLPLVGLLSALGLLFTIKAAQSGSNQSNWTRQAMLEFSNVVMGTIFAASVVFTVVSAIRGLFEGAAFQSIKKIAETIDWDTKLPLLNLDKSFNNILGLGLDEAAITAGAAFAIYRMNVSLGYDY